MSNRLPPLTALRAFEAAARHLSFSHAAAELGVTPAALSFQIKSIEEHFGAPLFTRHARAVALTDAGSALLPGLSEGFASFERAWRAALRTQTSNILNVTTGPAFMAKWMAPRVFDFARKHPEIELRFAASLRLQDFDHDGIDVAIRFGKGPDTGLYSLPLGNEWLTPAMTPALAQQYTTPESLLTAPLIFDDSMDFLRHRAEWSTWFRACGVEAPPLKGTHFSNADHSIGAAIAGAGVVLGRSTLMARDITEGRLVAPFKTGICTQASFRFLCPLGNEKRPEIAAFRNWVIEESRSAESLRSGRNIVELDG